MDLLYCFTFFSYFTLQIKSPKAFWEALARLTICTNQSFTFVESDFLWDLFETINPFYKNYRISTGETIRSDIMKMFELEREKIKVMLEASIYLFPFVLCCLFYICFFNHFRIYLARFHLQLILGHHQIARLLWGSQHIGSMMIGRWRNFSLTLSI